MMEMLVANNNMLISTEKFMESVWGYDSEAEINGVWVYISSLRKNFRKSAQTSTLRRCAGSAINWKKPNDQKTAD